MGTRNNGLLRWLKASDDNTVRASGASRSYLRLIGYGHKRPSALVAAGVERASNGAVTRRQLRPDDWYLIWPELTEDTKKEPS